jgi:hypothetical protein
MNHIQLLEELKELTKWNYHTTARATLVKHLLEVNENEKTNKGLKLLRKSYSLIARRQSFDGYLSKKSRTLRDEADDILYMLLLKVLPIQSKALWGAL